MQGIIRVPIIVAPASGTTATTFTLTLTSALATGFTYDVQRRLGIGAWTTFPTGDHRHGEVQGAVVGDLGAGCSRLVRTPTHAASKWSPTRR